MRVFSATIYDYATGGNITGISHQFETVEAPGTTAKSRHEACRLNRASQTICFFNQAVGKFPGDLFGL